MLTQELTSEAAPNLGSRADELLLGPYARRRGVSPLPLTRRMVRHLRGFPQARSPIAELRWSQVAGVDGSPSLCRAVALGAAGSRIGDPREEAWWLSAFEWLAKQAALDPVDVPLLFEYFQFRRYGDLQARAPADPMFSLKGRKLETLLAEAREWQAVHAREVRDEEFAASGLRPGRWEVEGPDGRCVWTVEEIRDSRTLAEEGRVMRHCVGTYGDLIEEGVAAIWSMRVNRGGVVRRAVTIDVDLRRRTVWQSSGRANRLLRKEEQQVLEWWAELNGLSIR